ncbi:hypothetical protein BGW38_001512 [Lunasporangiospora selenospora]|uniref:Uncharacterized protein n=1 Tax=Lunasporangiospora selenospora TaxID=979761 RepID=A0A9P6KE18_9FUNG|nr:hypothetical protein BGW38_001512 [Lunasporangiospora selenospora]
MHSGFELVVRLVTAKALRSSNIHILRARSLQLEKRYDVCSKTLSSTYYCEEGSHCIDDSHCMRDYFWVIIGVVGLVLVCFVISWIRQKYLKLRGRNAGTVHIVPVPGTAVQPPLAQPYLPQQPLPNQQPVMMYAPMPGTTPMGYPAPSPGQYPAMAKPLSPPVAGSYPYEHAYPLASLSPAMASPSVMPANSTASMAYVPGVYPPSYPTTMSPPIGSAVPIHDFNTTGNPVQNVSLPMAPPDHQNSSQPYPIPGQSQ